MSLAAAPSSQLPPWHFSRTGTGGNGRRDLGCGGEGRGQGQVLTAEAPLWQDPVTSPWVARTPLAAGGSPVGPPRGSSWDHLSSPTARGSHGSELRSSTRGAAGAAVVPKGGRVVATDGSDHLPTAPRGAHRAWRDKHQNLGRAGDRQEKPRKRRDLRLQLALRARDLPDP